MKNFREPRHGSRRAFLPCRLVVPGAGNFSRGEGGGYPVNKDKNVSHFNSGWVVSDKGKSVDGIRSEPKSNSQQDDRARITELFGIGVKVRGVPCWDLDLRKLGFVALDVEQLK